MLTAGLLYFTQVSVGGSYVGDLMPGFLIIGVGIGFSFVPISIAALAGVQAGRGRAGLGADQHLAADRWRARHRRTLHDRHVADRGLRGQRLGPAQALVDGFSSAFLVGAIVAALGLVAALTLIRRDELEAGTVPAPEAELVLDAA